MVSSERRLAAILAGDVVGYSKLVHSDEDEALLKVKHSFEMVETVVKLRSGRVVKTMGDGFIAEFASVVAAFEAARAILENIKNNDADGLTMRMGLHVGDIVFEADGDILGNGVNIAARLEGFAQPGNIAVSGRAADELLRRKIEFFNHGAHQLKNIDEPVEIYEYGDVPDDVKAKVAGSEKGDAKAQSAAKAKAYIRNTADEPVQKSSKGGTGVRLLLLVVALAGAGTAGWWFTRPTFAAEQEINAISCSWLKINGHNEISGRDVWSISGFSIQTADQLRQTLMQKAVDQNATKFDVIVGDIIPIERSQCTWIEKAKKFAYLGIPRLSISSRTNPGIEQTGDFAGKRNVTTNVVKLDLNLLRRNFFVYAIEPNGAISYAGDREQFKTDEYGNNLITKDNKLDIPFQQDHSGSSALIVLEADRAPPPGLVEKQNKTMADIQDFYDIGKRDNWSINLVQFVASGSANNAPAGTAGTK